MIKFAKLFEYNEGQILFTKGFNEESEEHKYTIDIRVDDADVTYEKRVGYIDKDARDIFFNRIEKFNAEGYIQSMIRTMGIE